MFEDADRDQDTFGRLARTPVGHEGQREDPDA